MLRRPTLVEFVVVQVAPDCRRIGRFRVRGHRGVNRIPLRGRVGRHSLAPGTYRIVARALPGGRTVVDSGLVVVQHATRREIQAARGANACPRGAIVGLASVAATGRTRPPGARGSAAAVPTKTTQSARHHGVLGAKFARRAISLTREVPLFLYLLLGIAIALLAAAALPLRAAPRRTAATLNRHRGTLAAAGASLLVVVMIAYVLL